MTMESLQQSLLEYLRSENPVVNNRVCDGGRPTRSKRNTWEAPRFIKVWKDFEYGSLKSIYGGQLIGVLEQPFTLQNFSAIPEFPFCEIHDEDSLECLIIKWSYSMMYEALSIAQSHLNTNIDQDRIHMIRGGQAQWPGGDSGFRPDWAGVKRPATSTQKSENVLPGDTKTSKVWSSKEIKLGEVEDDPRTVAWLRPLCQIFAYCVRSNARYGYLFTDKELVVVRIRPGSQTSSRTAIATQSSLESFMSTPATRARNAGILEYQAIPWNNDWEVKDKRCTGMTVNLALWWLHMMAAEESIIEDHYTPLPGAVRKIMIGPSTKADIKAKSSSQRGRKRDRDDNVGQVARRGRKPRL